MDAIGPARERGVLIDQVAGGTGNGSCALAGRRLDHDARFSMDSLIDATGFVQDGILYWDIPEGEWRIFICKVTGNGRGGSGKELSESTGSEGTRAFLDLVYEEHYRHLGADFRGIPYRAFTDEPRFGEQSGL